MAGSRAFNFDHEGSVRVTTDILVGVGFLLLFGAVVPAFGQSRPPHQPISPALEFITSIESSQLDRSKATEQIQKNPKAGQMGDVPAILQSAIWSAVRRSPIAQRVEWVNGKYGVPAEPIKESLGNMYLAELKTPSIANKSDQPVATSQFPPGENFFLPSPAGYKIGHQQRQDKTQIIEQIPSNETIENWSEILTALIYFGGVGATPEQHYERIKTSALSDCNGAEVVLIAKGETNGYPYALWRMHCPLTRMTGKPEYSWVKAIGGKDSFYMVTIAFKRKPSLEEGAKWKDYLQELTVCDTRIPERACSLSTKPERRVAAEQPRNVLGTLALVFVPTRGANTPEPPMVVTLVIQPLPDGHYIRHLVTDPFAVWHNESAWATSHQNFLLALSPGSYRILGLEIQASSLSDKKPVILLTGRPSFAVPDQGCVYLGQIGFVFLRLPPASFAKSQAMVEAIAKERDLEQVAIAKERDLKQIGYYYSVKGALVISSISVDTPPESGRTSGDEHAAKHYTEAVTGRCTVGLAQP